MSRQRHDGLHAAVQNHYHVKEQGLTDTQRDRCGVSRIRTDDLLLAKQVLYQLSYNPA